MGAEEATEWDTNARCIEINQSYISYLITLHIMRENANKVRQRTFKRASVLLHAAPLQFRGLFNTLDSDRHLSIKRGEPG